MMEQIAITAASLFLGALLSWFFNWIARPDTKAILLVPLVLPGVIWFGVSGQLKQVSAPGGFQVIFAAEAKAPVGNFTARGDLSSIFVPMPMMVQMAVPAPPRFINDLIADISDEVLMGDITRRLFYWFTYEKLDPAELLRIIKNSGRRVANDDFSEFLVFGPAVGEVDCYFLDVDFVQKEERFAKTLEALVFMPAAQRRTFLMGSDLCTKPLEQNVPAIDALRRLDNAKNDEAIVVTESGGYLGIAFRDTIISSLVTSLIEALVQSR